MSIIKYILYSLPLSILGLGISQKAQGASSTVMMPTPDIADLVDGVYNVAHPLWDSFFPWVIVILGIIIVFAFIRLFIGLFHIGG